jgi:hypothetical protein
LQKLSEVIPFLSVINNLGPTVVGIIQGILPAVALAILISLVPIIFGILSKNEGIPQKSFVQLSVLHKFFFFQFFDVVLVSTISGGIANILSLVKNPLDIITTLSANLPQASTFFITFVMLQATNQAGQSMAQVVPYLLSYLSPIFATTPRQLVGQKRTCPTVNLGTLIPGHTVIFVLGLEYAVIAPLIIPFIILFYAFNYFVYLYQFLYVYELEFETAGRAFPRAIRHVYVGLFTSELTLVGLFAIRKGATGQLVLMIITLVLTVFSLAYYDKAFKPLFKYLPISRFGEDEETQPLLEDSHEDQDKRAKINSLSSDDSDSFPVVFAGHKESRDELVKDINDEDPENNHQENHSKDHLKARVPVIKKATNSSESSPTPVEAYHARNALLNRLLALEQKDDRQLNDEERDRLLRTAKSLYATEAYMHPSSFAPYPTVWIPDDDLGIAQQLIKKMRDSDIDGSSRSAAIVRNEKGKSYVTIDEERLIHEFGGIPGAPPTAVREGNVENYIRVLVDSLNFAGAITI